MAVEIRLWASQGGKLDYLHPRSSQSALILRRGSVARYTPLWRWTFAITQLCTCTAHKALSYTGIGQICRDTIARLKYLNPLSSCKSKFTT